MIRGGPVLGLIPARGGSRGIPRKNLLTLAGKPLLQWTAEAALASRFIDRLIVSTDDDEIAAVARSVGIDVPFRRPAEFASDTATDVDVVRHAISEVGADFEYIVYLQPTTPLRTTADIDGVLGRLEELGGDFCVSVQPSPFRPEWIFWLAPGARLDPAIGRFDVRNRQDLPPCYQLNGAVYAARISAWLRDGNFLVPGTVAYAMAEERSLDLDVPDDVGRAERFLLARREASV